MTSENSKFFIGVDVGTQSAKVNVFDLRGNIVASAKKKLRSLVIPSPLLAEHPEDDIWTALDSSIEAAINDFKTNTNHKVDDIKAMGLCVIRCCRALLKKDGSLAYPLISWMDKRLNVAYEWKEDYGEVAYVTASSGYISQRLTGEFKDTCANYIGQWPIDNDTFDWTTDDDRIASLGLNRSMLFDLVKPGEVLGTLRPELATKYGLSKDLKIVASAHDKAVEALGAGSFDDSTVLISLGTYIGAMIHGKENLKSSKNFWPFQASIPGDYLYECMGVRRGMWTVSWFCEQFGESFIKDIEQTGMPIEDFFNEGAQNIAAGSEGLVTIHDWAPPSEAQYRKGVMFGFDGRHTKFHIYRSILEGIVLTMKNHVDKMLAELEIELKSMILSGGGSESDLLCQIFSDVFGIEVIRNQLTGSASLGAAINAAMMDKAFSTYEEAKRSMVKVDRSFLPQIENHKIYSRINTEVYQLAHSHFDPVLINLSKIVD